MEAITLTGRMKELHDAGFTSSFRVAHGMVHCDACGIDHSPNDEIVERTVRFEGESDPDDMAILLGLRCSHCEARGVLVAGYGPLASAEDQEILSGLTDGRDM